MTLRGKTRVKATGFGLGTRVATPVNSQLKAPQSNLLGLNPNCLIATGKALHTPAPTLSKGTCRAVGWSNRDCLESDLAIMKKGGYNGPGHRTRGRRKFLLGVREAPGRFSATDKVPPGSRPFTLT